jgi:hypothetical protein
MVTQDTNPANLSPEDMAQLRAQFRRIGMSPVQAAQVAVILAGMPANIDGLRAHMLAGTAKTMGGMDGVLAELRTILERMDRMEADLAAMVERRRPPA